jgi:hypothetical protein
MAAFEVFKGAGHTVCWQASQRARACIAAVQARWREPAENGGRKITEYQAQISPGPRVEGHDAPEVPSYVQPPPPSMSMWAFALNVASVKSAVIHSFRARRDGVTSTGVQIQRSVWPPCGHTRNTECA